MNLSALRYFLEVARCSSIRRASERLHVAASAISRQISSLEHELDCVLLERRSDGVALTPAGERLRAHGIKIYAQIQLVRSDIDELRAVHRGSIRLATVEGITENYLPQIMTEFGEIYKDVSFEIRVASRDGIVDALDRYETEIGFVYDFTSHPTVDVIAHYLQPLHAFVPRGHPLAGGQRIRLRELLDFDHVLPDASFGISQLVNRIAKKERATVSPKVTGNTLQFLRRFAILNAAVVFMPVQAAYSDIRDGLLVPVNLDCDAFEHRKLSIAVRRQRDLSPATLLFSQFARDRFDAWQELDRVALAQARTRSWTA
ncbi:MAG: LysR family transcriptional regulator [Rhodobacteraceae bacterium]|nr:LysR family transcriptional regulator [Paracoccaceae bacterium]